MMGNTEAHDEKLLVAGIYKSMCWYLWMDVM